MPIICVCDSVYFTAHFINICQSYVCDSVYFTVHSVKNIYILFKLACGVSALLRTLRLESFIHVDFIYFLVIHVWHQSFPLNGIKKYITLEF